MARAGTNRGPVAALARQRAAWLKDCRRVVADLEALRECIDELGERGYAVTRPRDASERGPDEIACYASNSIEGTLALLRDLEARVMGGVTWASGVGARAKLGRRRRG